MIEFAKLKRNLMEAFGERKAPENPKGPNAK